MYESELECSIMAARAVEALLRNSFSHGYDEESDLQAEHQIHSILTRTFPSYGYLGEELGLLSYPRDEGQHLWLVDPHSGTEAAMDGYRGGAVSIALLQKGKPVLGVVLAYSAPDDRGELFSWAAGLSGVQRNGAIVRRAWPSEATSRSIALVSHEADVNSAENAKLVRPMRYRSVAGLAYRLALVAVGDADLATSLNCPTGWDFAAGHALLLGAGGNLYTADLEEVVYDISGSTRSSSAFLGTSQTLVQCLRGRSWSSAFSRTARRSCDALASPLRGKTIQDADLLARAQGCLLGQLTGDALGSLVEFCSAREIINRYSNGPTELEDGGTWSTIAGQPTDDSELALALARSIVTCSRYDEESAAAGYARWYESRPFDMGMATRAALSKASAALRAGQLIAPAAKEGAKRDTEANGALMRISPLAIYAAQQNPELAVAWARGDAELTHPAVNCSDSNVIFTLAVSHAIRKGVSPSSVYQYAVRCAEKLNASQQVQRCLQLAAVQCPVGDTDQQGWVLIALQNAFYQLLHADSFRAGVIASVRIGGDTDTNAAIAGALLGATYGRDAIPLQWRNSVLSCRPLKESSSVNQPRPMEYWPVDALCMAERLLLAGKVNAVEAGDQQTSSHPRIQNRKGQEG